MTDEELLGALIGLFDSRREAEHVVRCRSCDVHSDGYEAGPYRCPDNPVEHREALIRWVMRRRAKVVWALGGFPPMTPMQSALAAANEMMRRSIVEQLQHGADFLGRLGQIDYRAVDRVTFNINPGRVVR